MRAQARVTGLLWAAVGAGALVLGLSLPAADDAAPALPAEVAVPVAATAPGLAQPTLGINTEALWQQLPPAPATVVGRSAVAAPDAQPRRVAVFVNNRTDPAYNTYLQALEDRVIATLAGADFAPISKDDTVLAVKQFPTDTQGVADRNSLGTQADRLLADQSTALSLAQKMGADVLVVVNLTALTVTARDLAATGIQGSLLNYHVGLNYRICEGVTGAALDGGIFNHKRSVRFSGAKPADDPALVEEMLDEGAQNVTAKLSASVAKIKAPPLPAPVEILIAATARDPQGNEISLPDLRLIEDNIVVDGGAALPIQVAATVEIDGVAGGTTPLRLRVAAGTHEVRLSRAGFEDASLTADAKNGLTLVQPLTLTAEGSQRWQQIRAFLTTLDVAKGLTAAQAEALRGQAQVLHQSGYRIDTTAAPTVTVKKKSVYSIE